MNPATAWTLQFDLDGAHLITPPVNVTFEQLEHLCQVQAAVELFVRTVTKNSSSAA